MNYIVWVNKCKTDDLALALRLWNSTTVDLVRFVAWSGGSVKLHAERFLCTCDRCNNQLSSVLLRCTEPTLDTALDVDPVLIERERRSDEYCDNTFVHYSFAHPAPLDAPTLMRIMASTDASLLYVTTAYDTVADTEDPSIVKINLVRRKTPGYVGHAEWLAKRISAFTHCKSREFETRCVSYFSQIASDGDTNANRRTTCLVATLPCAIG